MNVKTFYPKYLNSCGIHARSVIFSGTNRAMIPLRTDSCNGWLLIQLNAACILWRSSCGLRLHVNRNEMRSLAAFNNRILKFLSNSNQYDVFANREYSNNIKEQNDVFYINNIIPERITCINSEGCSINWDDFRPYDDVDLVLYIRGIWCSEKQYGFSYVLCQMRRNEPLGIRSSLFIKSNVQNYVQHSTNTTLPSTLPSIPPPPPPPQISKIFMSQNLNAQLGGVIVRPTLEAIIESRQKLRKSKIMSS